MDMVSLIISLISGAVGGNIAGAAMKEKSLGVLGNSIAGIVGGGIGSWILSAMGVLKMAAGAGALDVGSIIGNIAGSGVGGAVLMLIIGLIKGGSASKSA